MNLEENRSIYQSTEGNIYLIDWKNTFDLDLQMIETVVKDSSNTSDMSRHKTKSRIHKDFIEASLSSKHIHLR